MANARDLAVHHLPRAHHLAAEGLSDRLVAQAHAEQRDPTHHFFDQPQGNACFAGRTRTGRNDDVGGRLRLDLVDADLIVPENPDRNTKLFQILHQVVGEGVVIVDHRDHAASAMRAGEASSAAFSMARALCWVSSHSERGSESATMPAAAWTWSLPCLSTAVRMAIATSMSPLKPR